MATTPNVCAFCKLEIQPDEPSDFYPQKTWKRWVKDGNNLKAECEATFNVSVHMHRICGVPRMP